MPKISVVMSVHNGEPYLRKSIESILNQTYTDFEFIIVDDGSNDGSLDTIEYFAAKDPRINLIVNQENRGLPYSLNKGIKESKGKYIARQDADDISVSTRLETQLRICESDQNIKLVGTNCQIIDINGDYIYKINTSKLVNYINELLNYRMIFPHGSAFFEKDNFWQLGGYNEKFRYSQDGELWLRFLMRNSNIKISEQYLYQLRILPQTSNRKYYGQLLFNQIKRAIYNGNLNESAINLALDQINEKIISFNAKPLNNPLGRYYKICATNSLFLDNSIAKFFKYMIKSLAFSSTFKDQIILLPHFFSFIVPKFILKYRKRDQNKDLVQFEKSNYA